MPNRKQIKVLTDTPYWLTKSKYIGGLQCPRRLFLDVYHPQEARYSAEQFAKFYRGRDFEASYKAQYPEGVDVSALIRKRPSMSPAITAQELSKEGRVVLFEAGFCYGGVLVLADVLVKEVDGGVNVFEVKSGSRSKKVFHNDVAVQHYVITQALSELGCGFHMEDFSLVYNDGNDGFITESLNEEAAACHTEVQNNIAQMRKILDATEPTPPLGEQCNSPYECPFKGYCAQHHNVQGVLSFE